MADLGRFGLEPRHLRAVKAAAEREAGLVEQAVAPLRGHRSPRTRAEAEATAAELAALLHVCTRPWCAPRCCLIPAECGHRHTVAFAESVPDYPNMPGTS